MAACLCDTNTLVSAALSTDSLTVPRSREKRLSSLRGGEARVRTHSICATVRHVEDRSNLCRCVRAEVNTEVGTSPSLLPSRVRQRRQEEGRDSEESSVEHVVVERRQLERSREVRQGAASDRRMGFTVARLFPCKQRVVRVFWFDPS